MKTNELTLVEREEISRLVSQRTLQSVIAKLLGKSESCISRELHRDNMSPSTYRAYHAHLHAQKEKKKSGRKMLLNNQPALAKAVLSMLFEQWSPTQIVERLKMEYPHDTAMRISHETIYRYVHIVPKGFLKKKLLSCLRQQRKLRRKRYPRGQKPVETRGRIPHMVSIDERPPEVSGRLVPGHWEGDLIVGVRKQSAIGTLTERTTRTTLIIPLTGTEPETVNKAFARAMNCLPEIMKKTLTYDQGREMKHHFLFTKATKIKVFFAHKSSPWERGTNENTNGLIRQYFPKQTDFRNVTRRQIKQVQDKLNNRPRKCLGFLKPNEVFNKLLQ
jgi:IS30 family transposase